MKGGIDCFYSGCYPTTLTRLSHPSFTLCVVVVVSDGQYTDTDETPVTIYDFHWRPPLAGKGEFKAGRTIPIKFTLAKDGSFIHDESVHVMVADSEGNMVFDALYGEGDGHVLIDDEVEHYITNWHTDKKMRGEYAITVTFASGLCVEKVVELVGK